MSRFFVNQENINEEKIYIEKKEDIHHITKVLRLNIGDEIEISDGREWEYIIKLSQIDTNLVIGRIVDKQKFAKEPEIDVTLLQGIPKHGKMELIIQKNVELGVSKIVPVFMKRTIVKEEKNFDKKIIRWQKISDEAVKQCRRGRIPQIESSCSFDEMIKDLNRYDIVLFPYENEDGLTIKNYLRELKNIKEIKDEKREITKIAIIIGPEGGFSDKEVDKLKSLSIKPVSLGKTTLRTETAGMAALAMTMYEYEM